jgi:hypothetical protein
MGIPLEEYAEASLEIVTRHALPIITVAASEMMLRGDMTMLLPGLSRRNHQHARLYYDRLAQFILSAPSCFLGRKAMRSFLIILV